MVAVPATMPLTAPAVLIDATLVALLFHAPPVMEAVKDAEVPVQITVGPEIIPPDGSDLTRTFFVTVVAPQEFVTV